MLRTVNRNKFKNSRFTVIKIDFHESRTKYLMDNNGRANLGARMTGGNSAPPSIFPF